MAVTAALVFGLAACDLFESWFGTDKDEGGLIKAAAPTADPPPGYVAVGTAVKLVSRTPGAVIYCTTAEGIPPVLNAAGNPVITGDTTLIAFARAEGYEDSDEVTFEYRVDSVTIEYLASYLRERGPTTRTLPTPSAWRWEPPSPAAPWGLSTTPSGTRESSSAALTLRA
ncbi:MAG: chitobiase/beta-hexosaminidase C-terminal domain-containing protein [Treponematales bacterium]